MAWCCCPCPVNHCLAVVDTLFDLSRTRLKRGCVLLVVLDFVVMVRVAVFVDEQVAPSSQTAGEANNVVVTSLRGRHQRLGRSQEAQWRCDKDACGDETSGSYIFRAKEESHRRPSCRSAWSGITFIAGLEQPDNLCNPDLECHSTFQNPADLHVAVRVRSQYATAQPIQYDETRRRQATQANKEKEDELRSKNTSVGNVPP